MRTAGLDLELDPERERATHRRFLTFDWRLVCALTIYGAGCLWVMAPTWSWVGDAYDDGGYFLMSRSIWRYGAPLLDSAGHAVWSHSWSPGLSIILAPLALLPMNQAILSERVAVAVSGAMVLILAYIWMRRCLGLNGWWAAGSIACLASAYGVVATSSVILSDAPAAAAVIASVLMARTGRVTLAAILAVAAFVIRPIDVVVIIGLITWLLYERRYVDALRSAAIVAVLGGCWVGLEALHGGGGGYLTQVTRVDLERPELGSVALGGLLMRMLSHAYLVITRELGGSVVTALGSRFLLNHAHLLIVVVATLLAGAATAGLWRRRLVLEGLVCLGTVAAVMLWPWDPQRFLLPTLPFVLGAAVSLMVDRGRRVALCAAVAGILIVATNLVEVRANSPSWGQKAASVRARTAAYTWTRTHIPRTDLVYTFADLQTFIYSGHTASRYYPGSPFLAGHTYIVAVPYASVEAGDDVDQRLLRHFKGEVVYSDMGITILRAEEIRPS